MQLRAFSTALAAVAIVTAQLAPQPALASNTQIVAASRIRYVYPDSPETSNAPFPPNEDMKAVHSALRHVLVEYRGHHVVLSDYLRTHGVAPSKVVTVKVQGDAAAIYTYR